MATWTGKGHQQVRAQQVGPQRPRTGLATLLGTLISGSQAETASKDPPEQNEQSLTPPREVWGWPRL